MKPWYEKNPGFYESEQRTVKEKFPTLGYVKKDGKVFLVGTLHLDDIVNHIRIVDSYEIEIEFPDNYPSSLPKVREVGGRKEKVVKEKGLRNIVDLHYYVNDESACPCYRSISKRYFTKGSTIETFLNELVLLFFYEQSYYEKTSNWPFGEYSHGHIGTKEFYRDELDIHDDDENTILNCIRLLTKTGRPKGHRPCPCGSSLEFRKCHPKVFQKLYELRDYVSSLEAKKDLEYLEKAYREAEKLKEALSNSILNSVRNTHG